MTRKSKREIEKALEDIELDEVEIPSFDGDQLSEIVDEARDTLPEEKVNELDDLTAEIQSEGWYADDRDGRPPHEREMTTAAKKWLNLVHGEAAISELAERGFE